jgi:uncharacterized SAM-binding protein YcdF (DUF218 family)
MARQHDGRGSMKALRIRHRALRWCDSLSRFLAVAAIPDMPMTRSAWRYLGDHDVQYAALVTVLALVLSAGMVWLGYLIHVCRVATRSPLVLPQRMVVLVFGQQLRDGLPGRDYQWRLRRVLSLVRRRQTDRVLLLGGRRGGAHSEAGAGYAWLQRRGLSADVPVELEHESVDSLENLRQARSLLRAQEVATTLPPVALVSSRYHLARCQLLARRLGFTCLTVAAEPALPMHWRYLVALLVEATYLMWIDLGMRWAQLTGNERMRSRLR